MPIFISYNKKDVDFVDSLARNLVAAKHHIWMDRWELSLGDSLIDRIQSALNNASAILVIISKSSIESQWCKKELFAGLTRELEEKKTLVMACVIDDCEIPLFLRDKLYANFKSSPDEAFNLVDQSLAKISNPFQGRSEQPEFHTDWAIDWRKIENDEMLICWTFVDHGHDWPYVILSECEVYCNKLASKNLVDSQANGAHAKYLRDVMRLIVSNLKDDGLSEIISDQFKKFVAWKITDKKGQVFHIVFTYRRMGEDSGMDTLVHLDNNLKIALEQMTDKLFEPATEFKR
jgi:hypothetical protein